jgi:hypothetical protein
MGSNWPDIDYEDIKSMGEKPDIDSFDDPFNDDTPIEASCDLENPESCESCQ